MQKINIMIIVGEKEVENQTLTIRRRFVKEQKELSFAGVFQRYYKRNQRKESFELKNRE